MRASAKRRCEHTQWQPCGRKQVTAIDSVPMRAGEGGGFDNQVGSRRRRSLPTTPSLFWCREGGWCFHRGGEASGDRHTWPGGVIGGVWERAGAGRARMRPRDFQRLFVWAPNCWFKWPIVHVDTEEQQEVNTSVFLWGLKRSSAL